MRKLISSTLSTIAFLICPLSLSSQNSFSLTLDLDNAPDDQALATLIASPDQVIAIQIFGRDIQNATGVSPRFEYNARQVTYQGFFPGNILSNAQVLAEHGTNPTFVQVSMVSFDSSATVSIGLMGTILFRTTRTFSNTTIRLTRAILSRDGQFETISLNVTVALLSVPSPDFDGDGRVGFTDFVLFASRFGSTPGDDTYEAKYDLDVDNAIGFSDFVIFARDFGKEVSSPGGSTPKIYWTDGGTGWAIARSTAKIKCANLNGSNVEDLVTTGVRIPEYIALDVPAGKMYWTGTDGSTNKIKRANLDGSNIEDLVTTGLTAPRGIALDVSRGKMYWTDLDIAKIKRANLDGSNIEDLIITGLKNPIGIALDLSAGKMYWLDQGADKIQRANLDGSNIEDLVTTGLKNPDDIALDLSAGKMYWTDGSTDNIKRANLDGSNVEDLITTGLRDPRGIALDVSEGKMYWIEWGTDKIKRANLDGSNIEDLVTTGLVKPIGIALYFPSN